MKAIEKEEEKKNKRTGIAVTVGIHALLLILFFFMIAWRMPNPPPPGLPGMEINLGFVDGVSTEEQPQVIEEKTEEEIIPEDVTKDALVDQQKLVNTDLESEHKVKNTEEANKKNEQVKKTPVVDPNNQFPPKGRPDGKTNTQNQTPGSGNEKGPGTGGGGNLNLPGWKFDYVPSEKDPSSESGYVTFKFTIDENGVVKTVDKISAKGLTPTVIEHYKKKLKESKFKSDDPNVVPEKGATGTFTFEIKVK
jgi:protein TonB